MNEETKKLWQEMADLTYSKCKISCQRLGGCCSSEYCDLAAQFMTICGEEVPDMPFIRNGACIIHPCYRPLCTLHQCQIGGVGFFPGDEALTDKYFELRDKLNSLLKDHVNH